MASGSSKGKGKQPIEPQMDRLANPAAGSSSPSGTLSSLWAYIRPALDHIVHSPTTDTSKAPSIDVDYYARIHSHTYNYFTAQSETANVRSVAGDDKDKAAPSGTDLYEQVDKYFADAAKDFLLAAEDSDETLVPYVIDTCFRRYHAGALSVNRLLNYVNRHYVKRAVDEDRGWLRLNDVLESVAKSITPQDTREKISKRFREKRTDELKKWDYFDGCSSEVAARAEACAEAASPLDRVVPVSSLALRRFRTEFIEPLLAVPKVKKGKAKVKNKIPKSPSTPPPNIPKGRLARAVKELLESKGGDEEEKLRLATELANLLKLVGVRFDHPLRKRLDKFIAQAVVPAVNAEVKV